MTTSAGTALSPDMKKGRARREMECLRRGAVALRTTRSAASSTRSRRWANWTTRSSSTSWATTAPAPRIPPATGMTSEIGIMGNGVDDRADFMVQNIDEFGGMWMQNHYSHGWAHAMNTPVPVGQEDRLAPGRHRRPRWSSPGRRASRSRRDPQPVHPPHRHRADHPRGRRPADARHRSTASSRCP